MKRFQLRSLMILVLMSALALASWDRLTRVDLVRFRRAAVFVIPLFILIGMKLGLALAMRARRSSSNEPAPSDSRDEHLP